MEWRRVRIEQIADVNPKRGAWDDLADNNAVTFVPMQAVSEATASIELPEVRPLGEVRRGFTPFQDGDVLFAKITPCMENGKVAIARNLVNKAGFGSTEFHVLRAGPLVLPEYLYYFIRQPAFRSGAKQQMRGGAGQQRVPEQFLRREVIPLPPLSEQRRIVEILDQADRLRRLRAEADAKADRILPALFIKMFGDPLRLLSHPSSRPLASFKVDLQNGFACGEKDVPGGIPHLRMNNISDTGRLDLGLIRTVPSKAYSERYRLLRGDVLFMSTNSEDRIGKACVFEPPIDGEYLFSNHLIRIRSSDPELIPEYLATFLHLLWRSGFYSGIAKRWVNQATVSRKALGTVRIPAFGREKQARFARAVRQMSVQALGAEATRRQLDALFSLLLHRTFSGSLTASWREAHMKELLQEMEQQAKALATG